MLITRETTDTEIMAPVEAAKQSLLEAASSATYSEEMRGTRLVGLAQNVASAEAVAHVAFQYRSVVTKQPGDKARMGFLMDLLGRGADDAGTGRKNDSARSSNDAVRAWAMEQFDAIRYGA